MAKNILVIAHDVTLAHVGRALTVAEILSSRGHSVTFATSKASERFTSSFKGSLRFLAPTGSKEFMNNLAEGKPVFNEPEIRRMVLEDEVLLSECSPDLVIGDFRLSLGISARLQNVPYANLTNAYWHAAVPTHFKVPEIPLVRYVGERSAQLLFSMARPAVFALHTVPYNRIKREFRLKSVRFDLRNAYTDADLNLFCDAGELYSLPHPVPNGFFIGPIDWSPEVALPAWYAGLANDIPRIYVSLGSSGNRNALDTVVRGLSAFKANILVATAGAPLQVTAPNVFAAPYLPASVVLQKASLFIGNGGSASGAQALKNRVPVLGVPTNLDQFTFMGYVVKNKLGGLIRSGSVTEHAVRNEVIRLLTDFAISEHTEAFSQIIEAYSLENKLLEGFTQLGLSL